MKKERETQIRCRDWTTDFKIGDKTHKHIEEMKEKHTYQDLLFYLKNISGILNSNYKYKELDEFLNEMTDLGIYDEEIDT